LKIIIINEAPGSLKISKVSNANLSFHIKNGFKECGRFQNICQKNGKDFDVIWMQKIL